MSPHLDLKVAMRIGGDALHESNAPDHPDPCTRKPTKTNKAGWCSCQTTFDVEFYPYTPPKVDPVFAVVRGRNAIVYRPLPEKDKGAEILRCFEDDDVKENLNSLAWSQDRQTGDPLLSVAGNAAQIKILNVKTGHLVQTFVGHGGNINDLATSPTDPSILASGSMDHSIRMWTLDPKYKARPCALICSGETHREGVLTIAFHRSGRYLLSGAHDTVVNMWAIPALPDLNTGTDKPTLIRYPYFSSTEVHANYVDCITFYGDMILSKAAREDQILLWKIGGFASDTTPLPITSNLAAPRKNGTRSEFQRLLTFKAPDMDPFYMRFGLFHQPHKHPMLAIGNTKSKVFFWDLQRLEDIVNREEAGFKIPVKKMSKLALELGREDSITSNDSSGVGSSTTYPSALQGKEKYELGSVFPIPAHRTIIVPKISFTSRKAAWSTGGEWCVVVGEFGMVCVFRRWDTD